MKQGRIKHKSVEKTKQSMTVKNIKRLCKTKQNKSINGKLKKIQKNKSREKKKNSQQSENKIRHNKTGWRKKTDERTRKDKTSQDK